MPTVADVVDVMAGWFPPGWAEPWDAVGLVCGAPDVEVRAINLAVDCVPATVAETAQRGAQLLITHHPLLLGGVTTVAATNPKGALVHRLVRDGIALYVAHTNADVARPGVSDALASRLGLRDLRPLVDDLDTPLYKIVVFVPHVDAERLIDALAAAGAGHIGDYDRCAWTGTGIGTFRPGPNAHPAIGTVGEIELVPESRVEMVLAPDRLGAVLAALRSAHPYEEPAFDVLAHVARPGGRGTGRVGTLPTPTTLAAFTAHAAAALPATTWGVRAAGDPDKIVRTVAVCGGSGGSYADAARAAGADVYLTADLKHHTTLEAVTERGPDAMALVDAAHWATEAPWLAQLAPALRDRLPTTVDVTVSTIVTDPWTLHYPSNP